MTNDRETATSGDVSIYFGSTTGVFSGPTDYGAGKNPTGIASADLDDDGDGDGLPDLSVPDRGQASDALLVLLNTTNRHPVARNDSYSVRQDKTLTVRAPGVLRNDLDPDGDRLTARIAKRPKHGKLRLNENGSFTYEPDRRFEGRDSFTYKANDGSASSKIATVDIRVR